MDIGSKPTSIPCRHHLLFIFLLVCQLSCYACHLYHAHLSCASFVYSLHLFLPLLVYLFLVFACACTHMERGCMELEDGLLGASKRSTNASMQISQATMFSRFRSLAFPFGYVLFQTPSFLLPFSLKWFLLRISCHVPFVLISRVWRPLFTFLHLYFGSCSKDVNIYFPTLCACIVHNVCIYIPARPLLV